MKVLPLKWRRRRDSNSDSSSPGDIFRRDKDHMIVILRIGIATDEGDQFALNTSQQPPPKPNCSC